MVVTEDVGLRRIIACGTLSAEPKFIHEAGIVGHIEDVVVDMALRGKGALRALCPRQTRSLAPSHPHRPPAAGVGSRVVRCLFCLNRYRVLSPRACRL